MDRLIQRLKTTAQKASTSRVAKEALFKELPNPYVQPVPPYIWIDFPQEKERLLGPVYVMRLGVDGATRVEISIDKGPWLPCRLTAGYWWYDWKNIEPGKHKLVARMHQPNGQILRTPIRSCEYKSPTE